MTSGKSSVVWNAEAVSHCPYSTLMNQNLSTFRSNHKIAYLLITGIWIRRKYSDRDIWRTRMVHDEDLTVCLMANDVYIDFRRFSATMCSIQGFGIKSVLRFGSVSMVIWMLCNNSTIVSSHKSSETMPDHNLQRISWYEINQQSVWFGSNLTWPLPFCILTQNHSFLSIRNNQ